MDGDGDRAGGRRGGGRDSRRSPQRRSGDRNDRGGDRGDRGDRAERNDRGGDRAERGDRNDRGPDRFDSSDEDGDFGRRRGRGGRFRDRDRDRNRRGGNGGGGGRDRNESEPTVGDDDVLLPVAGIVDILDNYAFIRTSGYLAGPNDVYVSLSQVRKYGIRRGDAVTGQVRQPRDGERQNKYNPLIRLETLNGVEADQAQRRPEFHKLTPLYPQDRLRLETEPQQLTTRVIDLVMPIGKGQRALIVSPPKAGKTMVLQALANAITTNNPECHLMVVLVDERPEEVTDMQRTVKGEVIASTFDRPPTDHTTVAELSIERAKRLVELGHDVVVLLDSITRLGRAYNLAAPASGRILSGGVDSTALYPPKRFLGAARNIEHGGSLTIIATALVETGSTMDTVIFEEFKGTGNAELKLDRRIADKRTFPAVDVDASSTRKEELLLASDELAIIYKLRKVLHALDSQQALDLVLDKLKKTRTNAEFLMQIQKTTPDNGND
jgi:transcription termination factor Rho